MNSRDSARESVKSFGTDLEKGAMIVMEACRLNVTKRAYVDCGTGRTQNKDGRLGDVDRDTDGMTEDSKRRKRSILIYHQGLLPVKS